jgi:ABC-2 type transport system permease protein
VIGAILRAQWLSMRLGGRRGAVFSILTGVIWYGIWSMISWVAFQQAHRASPEQLARYLPLALLGVWVYWQLVPVLSASLGSSLDMRKLVVYPIPHSSLFQVEILLRLMTGAEMLLVVSAAAAGLAGNTAAGWRAVPAAAGFIAFNVLLSSGARSLLERLLSRRRVREVLVFLMFMLWMVPRFLFITGHRPESLHGWGAVFQSAAWPWTAAAWVALGHSTATALLSLGGWALAALWFGRSQFERSLRFDAAAAQSAPSGDIRSRPQAVARSFYRLPAVLFPDPLAAIVEKELRTLVRTPRYRMVFVMGFSFGLMVWLPMMFGAASHHTLGDHFLTVVCVYALTLLGQVSYWNCFGFDRSAVQIYYVAPQPMRTILVGKNLASLVFIYLESLILTAAVLAFHVGVDGAQVVETFLVIGVCSLYMLAMGNIASVQYPRGLNPERVSQGGASSRFQALVLLLYPLCLIPVALAYLARYAFSSELIFYLVLLMAASIGAIVYWIALDSAVATAASSRERIIAELSSADGPVASN